MTILMNQRSVSFELPAGPSASVIMQRNNIAHRVLESIAMDILGKIEKNISKINNPDNDERTYKITYSVEYFRDKD